MYSPETSFPFLSITKRNIHSIEVFIRDTEYIFEDISRNTTWIKNVSIKKKKNRIFRDRYKGGRNVTIIRSQAGRVNLIEYSDRAFLSRYCVRVIQHKNFNLTRYYKNSRQRLNYQVTKTSYLNKCFYKITKIATLPPR